MLKNSIIIRIIILIFFGVISNIAYSVVKEIGVPTIQNFERSEYIAGTQNWAVEQGSNGVMYFGNNNGLLRYDGQFWGLFSVPNGSNVRSLHFSESQQILYVGAYNEIGYFSNDKSGKLIYNSLMDLIPKGNKKFGDIWKIYEGPWGIVFQAFEGLYFYKDGKIEVVLPRSIFHYSYFVMEPFMFLTEQWIDGI